jgi:hypothetical protein
VGYSYLFSCISCSNTIVPLSAYAIQQNITNNPNTTIAKTPPYSSLIPSLLRLNAGDFVPHTFTIGDAFLTNFSLFASYTILGVYDRQDSPGSPVPLVSNAVSSFAYKNYDLAQCDVLGIIISMDLGSTLAVAGVTVCFLRTQVSSSPLTK